MSYTYEHPRPAVTVDVVVFGLDLDARTLQVLLIRRGTAGGAFAGAWAIPGGFVRPDEALEVAARRELREETKLEPSYIEQLYTFGRPGRDPRGHVVSVAYMALVRCDAVDPRGGTDAEEARWFTVGAQPELAFDHDEILARALTRLRTKVRWQPIGIDLLPEVFTLSELQRVYEIILGTSLDKRNFRKKVLGFDVLISADSRKTHGGPGRPAQLYRFDRAAYEALAAEGVDFEV